jgi:hypothetical protein
MRQTMGFAGFIKHVVFVREFKTTKLTPEMTRSKLSGLNFIAREDGFGCCSRPGAGLYSGARQGKGGSAAQAHALGFNPDLAAMNFDDALDQREPYPGSFDIWAQSLTSFSLACGDLRDTRLEDMYQRRLSLCWSRIVLIIWD